MPLDVIDIHSPLGGLSRRMAFQSGQDGAYTSPDEDNVRGVDSLGEDRQRIGSRPGLEKSYSSTSPIPLGSGSPIRLMAQARSTNDPAAQTFTDTFSGSSFDSTNWEVGDWGASTLPTVSSGRATLLNGSTSPRAAITKLAAGNTSTSLSRSVSIYVDGSAPGGTYSLLMDTRAAAAGENEGVRAVLIKDASTGKYAIDLYIDGVEVASTGVGGLINKPFPNWFKMTISATKTVTVYWTDTSNPDLTYAATDYTPTQARSGFEMELAPTQYTSPHMYVNDFRLDFTEDTGETADRFLVASANGSTYYETTDGTFDTATGLTLGSSRLLHAASRLQSLYIADRGTIISGTGGTVDATPGLTFDDAATADWTAVTGLAVGDYLRIASGTNVTVGDYRITAVAAGSLTIDRDASTGGAASSVVYDILRGPKVLTAGVVALLGASSTLVPPGCTLVAQWRDRIVLAGDPGNPHRAYMSARGDPTDWTYANDTPDSAYAYSVNESAGELGDSITALLTHRDDYLLFGCTSSIYIQRGDPTYGGSLDVVATGVGVVSGGAWCVTPEGFAVVLGADGLYAIAPASDAVPQRLSRERIPRELIDLSSSLYDVQMHYDVRHEGIHVFVTPISAGSTTHWYFEWSQKAFRKVSMSNSHEPTASCVHFLSGSDTPVVLLGGRDGYIRHFDQSQEDDDGTDFTSYSIIGPIMLGGGGYYEGILREVVPQLSTLSGEVTLKIRVGDSIESAYQATSRVTYTMRAGKGRTYRPNLRGNACFLELYSAGGSAWALEQMSLVRERLGKQRLLS